MGTGLPAPACKQLPGVCGARRSRRSTPSCASVLPHPSPATGSGQGAELPLHLLSQRVCALESRQPSSNSPAAGGQRGRALACAAFYQHRWFFPKATLAEGASREYAGPLTSLLPSLCSRLKNKASPAAGSSRDFRCVSGLAAPRPPWSGQGPRQRTQACFPGRPPFRARQGCSVAAGDKVKNTPKITLQLRLSFAFRFVFFFFRRQLPRTFFFLFRADPTWFSRYPDGNRAGKREVF